MVRVLRLEPVEVPRDDRIEFGVRFTETCRSAAK